jgi:hypothetical protein
MGVHVLTLASAMVKHTVEGQLSEDNATCEWDADSPEAGVLDKTRRVSRLLAKTRRDESLKHRERRKDDVEDCDLARDRRDRPNQRYRVMLDGPLTTQHRSSGPRKWERARKSTLASQGTFAATRDLTTLFLVQENRMIGLEDERGWSAQSGHNSRGRSAPPGRR